MLVTSAESGDGKSTTALSIARHFSVMGLKVLVVDADLRNPSLHNRCGLDNSVGLSNYLTGNCSPLKAIQRTDLVNLFFMSSGPLPPNAADLLGGSRLSLLLSVEEFDLIVIDSPPVLGLADALLLSNTRAVTVFVAAAGQARTGAVRNALKRLELARAPIIGAIITKFDVKTANYGYGVMVMARTKRITPATSWKTRPERAPGNWVKRKMSANNQPDGIESRH
jgi:capsular exopolysaccharide synthesis family protein